jgi:hypothetical protein
MKLGIACVYLYGPDGGWILDLQLRYIASTLSGYDYKIYAAANRLRPELRARLNAEPHLEVVDLPWYENEGNREHAFYLDRLLRRAAEEGCTHLAALDSDSFPILSDWPRVLLQRMGSTMRIAAVFRAENRDTHLPHPCGYFMLRSFFLERRPELYPDEQALASKPYQRFLAATRQRVDTGIGYAYTLWAHGEPWLQLTRSNRRNPHFLMAGIYGRVFFHLGAASRAPAFHVDYLTRPSLRIALGLRDVPLLWRVSALLESRYTEKNALIYKRITEGLKSDPQGFLAALG